jgi:pyruvate kinase
MVHNRRPTRAEVSDVANAVLDGADALMLSAETSVGDYPVEAVVTMGRIMASAEEDGLGRMAPVIGDGRDGAVAAAAVRVSAAVGAKALVAFTQTGHTARLLARHRPALPLFAFTPDPAVRSQLSHTWSVETFLLPPICSLEEALNQVDLVTGGRGCAPGDRVVVVVGHPGQSGSTHTLRVHEVRP